MTRTRRYYRVRSVARAITTMIVMITTIGTIWALLVVVSIEEDQPGWNCATMGNRICGPGGSK